MTIIVNKKGKTLFNSMWNNYSLQEILEVDCGRLKFDGTYLTKIE